jgi:hypothetical protein
MDNEVKDNVEDRRSFLGPDNKTLYYIVAPTAEDIRGADWNYSKIFTKSLMEGITTSHEMTDILMRRGVIGPEFDQRSAELSEDLNNKILLLEMATTIEAKKELSMEVSKARDELFRWNQRLSGPMSNTCEQMADDSRLEYLTACIVQNEAGERVWDSYDTFLKEKSQGLALTARFEVMLYLQGMDSDFLNKTPEAIAMKEVSDYTMEQATNALKAAQAVAEEERLKQEESDNNNNTTTRKKKATKKVNEKK